MKNLRFLVLTHNYIEDFSPLAGLTNLQTLWINNNWGTDFSPLAGLNLTGFRYDEICNVAPSGKPIGDRIKDRTFPSIVGFLPQGSIEDIARFDFHHGNIFRMGWDTTQNEPTHGLATQLAGDVEKAKEIRQQLLQHNPNMLFFAEVRIHNHPSSNGAAAFPADYDFYLKDNEGNTIHNQNGEYMMNILNPDLQNLLIERIVGFAECGIYDGVLLDGFGGNGVGFVGRHLFTEATNEEIIEAITLILHGVRDRARDDFLIIVNAGRTKPTRYTEYVNGSSMEPGADYFGVGGGTRKLLQTIDEVLLWNEENLRYPQVNWTEGFLLPDQPPDSPDNQRRMRLFTTRGLTLSDSYVRLGYTHPFQHPLYMDAVNFWFSFWDADLGQPVGKKAQLYEDREGLFIREFTNGWAVYNRSGQAQEISLPIQTTGVASDITSFQHTVPDLDGEMFLKTDISVDVNGDGEVNILDLVAVANAFGKAEPDLNGDGVVNILDLVIVANAF